MSLFPGPHPRSQIEHAFPLARWADSGLGAPQTWPRSLRTYAQLAMETPSPVVIAWGDELRLVYNDAYAEILGDRHPAALGQPLAQVWPEIWSELEPLNRRTLAGEGLHLADVEFVLHRHGEAQRTWFSFSYTPARDDDGRVAGVYATLTETTHKVVAEQHRVHALERLRQMFDRAPGFMAMTSGPDHRVELVNEACRQLIGRADVIGKPVHEAVPELGDQVYLSLFDQVYRTGEPYLGQRMQVYFQPPGAERMLRFVDFVYQPIVGVDGAVTGVFVQGVDVTEQCNVEAQLRESELVALKYGLESELHARKLDALLDAAPVGILYADAVGRLELVNPAIRRAWGDIPDVATVDDYRHFKAWWADGSARHGQPLQPTDWPLARALKGEDDAHAIVEVESFHSPGTRRTVKLQAKTVRAQGDAIVGAVVAEMDITEQVEAQDRLRESEARFRTMTDAMPQIVWSAQPDGHHDYFNQGWYDYTGVPAGSSIGDGWIDVVHPEDRAAALEVWQRSLATGEPYQAEYRYRHRSGEYRWILGRALPVRDTAGRILRWMGTSTDIHEHKRAQEHLQDASRRKDEFLAMLAHELRNPLAPIRASAHLLARVEDIARVRELGDVVHRQSEHMTRMIDDLLDVSRVTRGLIKLERDLVDLGNVVSLAVEQVGPLIDEREHVLDVIVPGRPIHVWGDRLRLVQVVTNLLNNAAKYTRQGGRIQIVLEECDGEASIRVIDRGSGIAPELLPFVFDLFTQGERGPDRAQGGLGIGLALARGIATLHGGRLTATSAGRGHGSCFTFTLPVATDCDVGAPVGERPARSDAASRRALQVVVVDDNVDAAKTIAMLLELKGHAVRVHANAATALEDAATRPADVYILDIGLPGGMSGYDLARALRARPQSATATLIALTGYGRAEDRALSHEAGFDLHFVKPVDPSGLIAALHAVSSGPTA